MERSWINQGMSKTVMLSFHRTQTGASSVSIRWFCCTCKDFKGIMLYILCIYIIHIKYTLHKYIYSKLYVNVNERKFFLFDGLIINFSRGFTFERTKWLTVRINNVLYITSTKRIIRSKLNLRIFTSYICQFSNFFATCRPSTTVESMSFRYNLRRNEYFFTKRVLVWLVSPVIFSITDHICYWTFLVFFICCCKGSDRLFPTLRFPSIC